MNLVINWVYRIFYQLVKTRVGSAILRWMVINMNKLLPLNHLRETKTLLAIYHPQPSYPFHVLLIPKNGLRNIFELGNAEKELLFDIFQATYSIVEEFGLEESGYRLVLNGGSYQDVDMLHFHLISEFSISS